MQKQEDEEEEKKIMERSEGTPNERKRRKDRALREQNERATEKARGGRRVEELRHNTGKKDETNRTEQPRKFTRIIHIQYDAQQGERGAEVVVNSVRLGYDTAYLQR